MSAIRCCPALLVAWLAVAASAQTPDNVLLVVADDVGIDRIGAYGIAASGPTPTIDQLAADGVRFDRAYATPVCSPTRAGLLTGRYGFRTRVGTNVVYPTAAWELDPDETTLADLLGPTHRTFAIGKWHVGALGVSGPMHPIDCGFEAFSGSLDTIGGEGGSASQYVSWPKTVATPAGFTQTLATVYATTDQVDDAIAAVTAAGDDPWFVLLAFHAAHKPFHAPPDQLTTLPVDESSPVPLQHRAMVEAMDRELARLLAAVPSDVLDRTWVVFLGDNGTPQAAVVDPLYQEKSKGTMFDRGARVPLVITGPGVVSPGRVVDRPVNSVDLFATALEVAGVPAPADMPDSVSLVPYLVSADPQSLRQTAYTELFSPNGPGPQATSDRAVTGTRYKLREKWDPSGTPVLVLYDLLVDPTETFGVSGMVVPPALVPVYAALLQELGKYAPSDVPPHGDPPDGVHGRTGGRGPAPGAGGPPPPPPPATGATGVLD